MKEGFWQIKANNSKKPFYKIPLFYIGSAGLIIIIFLSGYFVGKGSEAKDNSDGVLSETIVASSVVTSPTVAVSSSVTQTPSTQNNLSTKTISSDGGSGKYYGWSLFEDKELGISLYYPPSWFAGRVEGKRIIYFHDTDNKYLMYFGIRDKGASDDISLTDDLPDGKMVQEGKITIGSNLVEKYKIVDGNKAKMYLYPKDVVVSEDGRKEFMAVFVADNSKINQSELDLSLTDERVIGEKILGSIEIE